MPIILITLFVNKIHTNSIEKEINDHTVQMIEQVKNNADFYIKDMENIINYLSQDLQVMKFLRSEYNGEEEFNNLKSNVKRKLVTFKNLYPQIAGILIVNSNDFYLSNEMYKISRDPLIDENWYKKADEGFNNIRLISKPIGRNVANVLEYSADDVVSIVKGIEDPLTNNNIGVILIDMKLNVFKEIIEKITFGKTGFLYITDFNGEIVYAPINPVVYRIKSKWFNENYKGNCFEKRVKSQKYQIIYNSSAYTNWKIVGVFSIDERLDAVKYINFYTMVITIITIIAAIFVAIIFTSSIAKPISKLRSLMKKTEEGNFDVHFNSKYSDEIGELGDSFNNMIEEIKKLIELVQIEENNKRKAEIRVLQAQIKPHFLYNTLDTIMWMAQEHNAEDIIELVNALTNLLRIGLNKGKELINISDEIKHVESYLIIQKVRYEDKFDYEINYDEQVLKYKVIKLVLQPLVENAIYHGIKEKRGKGKIIINIKLIDDKICLNIYDNGKGILPNKLKQINNMLTAEREKKPTIGYGMFNVNERIRLSFGNKYGLIYKSTYDESTMVEVWHPILE